MKNIIKLGLALLFSGCLVSTVVAATAEDELKTAASRQMTTQPQSDSLAGQKLAGGQKVNHNNNHKVKCHLVKKYNKETKEYKKVKVCKRVK